MHAAAGIVIVSVPMLVANIPISLQSMTIGAALAVILNVAKTYLAA